MLEEMATLLSRDFCDQMCFSLYGIITNICKLELIYVLHNSFYRFNFILIYRGSTLDHLVSLLVNEDWYISHEDIIFDLEESSLKKLDLLFFFNHQISYEFSLHN